MTEQERQMIVGIGDALRANPVSWNGIDESQKSIIVELMRPRPSFTQEQRGFLDLWWLSVSDIQLSEINALLPRNTVIEPRVDGEGKKWLSADLFTDAVDEGAPLRPIIHLLLDLKLHYLEESHWPIQGSSP